MAKAPSEPTMCLVPRCMSLSKMRGLCSFHYKAAKYLGLLEEAVAKHQVTLARLSRYRGPVSSPTRPRYPKFR